MTNSSISGSCEPAVQLVHCPLGVISTDGVVAFEPTGLQLILSQRWLEACFDWECLPARHKEDHLHMLIHRAEAHQRPFQRVDILVFCHAGPISLFRAQHQRHGQNMTTEAVLRHENVQVVIVSINLRLHFARY